MKKINAALAVLSSFSDISENLMYYIVQKTFEFPDKHIVYCQIWNDDDLSDIEKEVTHIDDSKVII